MWNEHFGIGVVEMMAAGTVAVVHDSGGPRMDIVTPTLVESKGQGVGHRASDETSYAEAIVSSLGLPFAERCELAARAVAQSRKFSDVVFEEALTAIVHGDESRLFRGKKGE
eukprot:CAMPEP_0185783996 /NCGR_PEP_ID=MMETSP1174-20130828/120338_1 /TAXON_ID=35687 /ORGANISM="Dictyocha speculum, Strain CCMP1381" /LENGTH=111 /DNA_ID=CAMNT_0028475347 /DNA_START=70 /DNA_END=405 /DNA_ORIENTATION=+